MTTVLLVEDNEMLRPILRRILIQLGYNAEAVAVAATALVLMQTVPVDVLLTDIRLPEMSGCRLVREVVTRYPKTRSGLISGYGMDHLLAEDECDPSMPLLEKGTLSIRQVGDFVAMLLEHPPWTPPPLIRKEDR